MARQIQVTKDFVDTVRKHARSGRENQGGSGGMQEAMDEMDRHSRTPVGQSAWNSSRRRLRHHVHQHQAPFLQHPISKPRFKGCVHSCPRCRLPRRSPAHHIFSQLGFTETIPSDPQDFDRLVVDKHIEIRDAIEFGDQESIFAVTDLIHTCAAKLRRFPSIVSNMVT